MNADRILAVGGMAFMAVVVGVALLGSAGAWSLSPPVGNAVDTAPPSNAPPAVRNGEAQRYQLGYKDYAFFFPTTGSDTLTVQQGKPVELEVILSGPNAVVGCMSSQKFPASLRMDNPTYADRNLFVAKPGVNVIRFTPREAGTFRFTCGMGMGVGQITVTA
ncbi:MAG: hypothetical protein HY520_04330 [Candidatus Aenigmarchaeota archaeon]|nr:hypothetical protein [Candidatus Aenigmarchaeota archaeon]